LQIEDLPHFEKLLIKLYDTKHNGWNLNDGGVGCLNPSEETRAKISVSKMGKHGPWLGKKLSAETKVKLSAAAKGKKHSEEIKAKMSASRKGKQKSEETKAKMRIAAFAREEAKRTYR
jgi:hypothetical protein